MFSSFRLRQPIPVLSALAVLAALSFAVLSPGSASSANRGGLAITAPTTNKPNNNGPAGVAARFGNRVLREGMAGPDVKVLKGIVRSKSLLKGSTLATPYDRPTTSAVRRFQRTAKMKRSGVVNKATSKRLIRSMRVAGASWYGPGLWGNRTACGGVLRKNTMGVAHKTLPCGSKVLIGYRGRFVMTKVIDRGPFIKGRAWDLTLAVSDALRFTPVGAGNVRSAVVRRK